MNSAFRALALITLAPALSACAWMPSFLGGDRPLQAALLEDPPAPRLISAAFTQTVPVAAAVPSIIAKMPLIKPKRAPRSPKVRVAAANAAALQEPSSESYINANQVYNFADGALYRLYAAPQQVSDIILQPGENLTAISAGDTTRWVVGDTTSGSGATKTVHILAKPYASGLKTNLVITTDRRAYHLELQSVTDTFMAALSWTYPQDTLTKVSAQNAPPPSPLDGIPSIENLHFNYEITGDNVLWKPVRAFDDGTHVYIQFPETLKQGDAPPLFVAGPGGSHDLVNYRVRGTFYVVDQIFDTAELRIGQEHQQVVKIRRTAAVRTADAH
jgi:P-type conjugative transfer protein TrbG